MKIGLDHIVQKDVYADYLRRLDVRAVLDHYGAEHCSETTGSDGTTEIVHSCLLDRVHPHHKNGDQNPSACANIEKKLYVCYGFGGMNFFHFIATMEGKEELADIVPVVGRFLSGAVTDAPRFREELEKVFAAEVFHGAEDLPSYSLRILDSWAIPHPYWEYRGISPEAQATLHLGYDERAARIVFPAFVEGQLVGWQKRAVPGETVPHYPKYKNSAGFPKSGTLYNLDVAKQYPRVLVVESPMSVARAVSLGVPNVVATWGAKISTTQINLLKDFERVYVWTDRDPAGLAGEKKLVEGLHRHTEVMVCAPDGGRDLGDADTAEIADKLEHAVPGALRLGEYDRSQ